MNARPLLIAGMVVAFVVAALLAFLAFTAGNPVALVPAVVALAIGLFLTTQLRPDAGESP